ncbi:hypothetical protein SRHO_G00309450 [Serrasalmus rhombeus]
MSCSPERRSHTGGCIVPERQSVQYVRANAKIAVESFPPACFLFLPSRKHKAQRGLALPVQQEMGAALGRTGRQRAVETIHILARRTEPSAEEH